MDDAPNEDPAAARRQAAAERWEAAVLKRAQGPNPDRYSLVDRPGAGLVRLVSPQYGAQIWARTNRPVRQAQECRICRRTVARGTAPMYAPATNGANRMHRICVSCIEGPVAPPEPE